MLVYCSPEEKIKQLEKQVNDLIEESCFSNSRGELSLVSTVCRDGLSCFMNATLQAPSNLIEPDDSLVFR